ncbi:uric acid degradation bifunctional protein TTL-like [Musa acuminata AAA Group]|uniref:uric acid degradation bifunctional protein TTL-like n=1 Tax=Musa acuminata AAA Group TaxID=214697 RepID=UPI0031DD5142
MTALSCVEEDVLRCCGSKRFAKEMVSASPFTDLDHALRSACDIWFDKELVEWNFRHREKFGFVFLICASGRGMMEILAELKVPFF